MPTRYGVSPWVAGVPPARRPTYPRVRGDAAAGVVIVGGGLTGCATALALTLAGVRPLLLEAGRVGQNAGRHAGVISPDPGPGFRELQSLHGLRATRTAFELWRRAALDAAAMLRRLNIRCGLESADPLVVTTSAGEKALRRELDARREAGLESSWLTPRQTEQLARLDDARGIRVRGGFTVDPFRACLGMLAAAVKRGARCAEGSAVTRVVSTRSGVEVTCGDAVIPARTVIVATGSATGEFKPLRRHFRRRERYLVMTEPLPPTMRRQLFPPATTVALHGIGAPAHHLRWAQDWRLLVSGADQEESPTSRRDIVLVQRTGQLMYETLRLYPVISGLRPEYGWDAGYGETADGLPYIGAHRNYPHHLFALGGDGGSITGAFLAARILARAVHGGPQKGDEVFGWTR